MTLCCFLLCTWVSLFPALLLLLLLLPWADCEVLFPPPSVEHLANNNSSHSLSLDLNVKCERSFFVPVISYHRAWITHHHYFSMVLTDKACNCITLWSKTGVQSAGIQYWVLRQNSRRLKCLRCIYWISESALISATHDFLEPDMDFFSTTEW